MYVLLRLRHISCCHWYHVSIRQPEPQFMYETFIFGVPVLPLVRYINANVLLALQA